MDTCRSLASRYNNNILEKIVNVYQIQFIDFKAPGFGDYLRGCFTMQQIIDTLNTYCKTNVTFDMDVSNHPMSQVLITASNPIDYTTLGNFHIDVLKVVKDESDIAFQHILGQTVDYMNTIKEKTFYTFCCKFAIYDDILPRHKELMRSKLIPNEFMVAHIASVKEEMGIDQYSVIHVRCKDENSFPQGDLDAAFIQKVKGLIAANTDAFPEEGELDHKPKKYILITNNDKLKKALNIQSRKSLACHTGQDSVQSFEAIRDTMTDFFLMSAATEIIAFSPYMHGTGFSMECAKLYDVPYKSVFIVDEEEVKRREEMRKRLFG